MRKLTALAFASLLATAAAAQAQNVNDDGIQGNALAMRGGVAATDRSIAVDSLDVSLKSVDNSIRQIAVMRDDVSVRSAIIVTGDGALKTISGNGNGSIGGGINVSAVGAANSISTTVTAASRSGRR
jgi:hypothetical protein